ncbi:MAG TPA: endopeptidase La [Clostridiaceae bacterium]|nr:endopeptidase La [Clostridiaceae bacterium]
MSNIDIEKTHELPLLPLRGLTIFPQVIMHFDVGREKSIKALDQAMLNNQLIFLVAQKDAKNDSPASNEIYNIGTISRVKQLVKLPGNNIRVLIEGVARAEIIEFTQEEPFFMVEVVEKPSLPGKSSKAVKEALKRKIMQAFEEYSKLSGRISPEMFIAIAELEDPGQICDMIASSMFLKVEQKQEILSEFEVDARMEKLLTILVRENEILEIEKDISMKVKQQIDKAQKEYYLKEQMKAIQSELGDKEGTEAEVEEYRQKMKNINFPEEVKQKIDKELNRMSKMHPASAEVGVIRTYLDWLFDLPWDKKTEEIIDLKRAEKILNEDHYGLEKVKERILEYLAIRKLKNDLKGPIICLVGPPGVGKTSIAKSIARAVNRKYVRMSLGGVRDEAEIRGHRRTYVGAMPGRIIAAMKQAGTINPLILLDEIDKLSSDIRGDPAAALLEVLDSEQNFAFRDHYLEVPYDLSDVMFITTANNLETIPRPLLDRMEVISIPGYTEEEKFHIAKRHLIPKQIKAHGLERKNLSINDNAIKDIIVCYTREAGVRNLEREIGTICRKAAKIIADEDKKVVRVTQSNLEKFLGKKKYRYDKANEKDEVGIARGLAWTPVGGDTLSIEVNVMPGKGKLELTGQLGDVMKESAKAAMSYIRSKANEFGLKKNFYNEYDIHIHIPEGAVPKDGPSAGITLATALLSALLNIPVKRNVAMTGEITLRGRVLPIGGLKEKVLAAHRAGIDTIIVPVDNKKDVEEIPEHIRKDLKFVYASNMDTVINTALVKPKKEKQTYKNIGKNENSLVITEQQALIENVENSNLIENVENRGSIIEQ